MHFENNWIIFFSDLNYLYISFWYFLSVPAQMEKQNEKSLGF